jgi:RNA polymerase sigma-54 factor
VKQGLSQSVRLGQELRINPRLYQAMDMLTMPLLDLQQHLKQELQQNPFLDLVEPDEEDEEEAETAEAAVETPEVVEKEEPPTAAEEENSAWEELMLEGFEEGSAGISGMSEVQEYTEPTRAARVFR